MSCLKTVIAFLAIVFLPSESPAGSWSAPRNLEVLSANGEHKVTVHAPVVATETKGSIVVESKIAGQWTKKWTQTVVNELMPYKVIINDSGSRVVTLGNWYGKENGDDSLVVYDRDRVLSQYSIAELAEPDVSLRKNSAGTGWLMNSHSSFDESLGFYLWMDYAKTWCVIDMTNGQLRELTPTLVSQCEGFARKSLLLRINTDEPDFSSLMILSRFMRAEDKELFEPLLEYPGDLLGCGSRHQSNKTFPDYGLIEYYQTNRYRDLAEDALDALAEGASDADYGQSKKDQYKRLSSLQLTAKFDRLPTKEDGAIVVWLEPITKERSALVQTRPAHAIGIDLLWNAPERYGVDPLSPQLSLPINFYGVTPGRYHLRGFWSKQLQSSREVNDDFWTHTGEFSVADGTTIELKKGATATAGIVFEPLETE